MFCKMDYKKRRMASYTIVAVYMFIGGAEYAVIFPTAWDYIQTLGVSEEYWLGFIFSVYSLSAAVAGVIGGRVADIWVNQTKTICLLSVVITIWGAFQYSFASNVWHIFLSRFLSGIGTAAGSAMLAEICRTTSMEERTPVLAICNATRQLGILIGPGFQLILSYFHFDLWGFTVTPLNVAGLFMGVFWILFAIATVFLYSNLSAEMKEMQRQGLLKPSTNAQGWSNEPAAQVYDAPSRRRIMSMSESLLNSYHVTQKEAIMVLEESASTSMRISYQTYMNEFLTDTFMCLIFVVFVQYFCIVATETIMPVIVQECFGFGAYVNSLIFMAGGIEALIVFFGVAFISRWVRETTLQSIGGVLMLVSQVWLLITIPIYERGNVIHLIYFMIGFVVLYLGYSIQSVANTGIASKLLSDETQGMGQGIRRLASFTGLIYGPIWAGSTVRQPALCLGVPIAIVVLHGIMLAMSNKELRRREDELIAGYKRNRNSVYDQSERDPLVPKCQRP